ncbi:MAG: hypothetical protein GF331_07545 [Chitinivibrionales bacterium]|nr:hypothetical protein [Chitinivibrionales bacterium]
MQLRAIVLMMSLFLITGIAWGQCDDPRDEVLCVATLSPTEEASYSSTDGQLADFWSDANWTGKDYIELLPPDNCYPDRCGFSGAEDASFIVKAAATARGLYLLALAKDNTWVDRADADDWGADAADLFFADQSSEEIASCTDCLIGLYSSALTYGTQQMQVPMGGSALPNGFRYARYDPNLWSWQTTEIDWTTAEATYGLEVEVVLVDANTKAQEWFLPWQKFGDGIEAGTDLSGKRFAFSGGYNDKDGDNPQPDCLRWLQKDPWTIEDGETYWGDLLLSNDIGVVEAVLPVAPTPRSTRALPSGMIRSEHFTLAGERLPDGAVRPGTAPGVVVQRAMTTGGAAATRRVLVR